MSRDCHLACNKFGSDDSSHLSHFVNEDVFDPTHPIHLPTPYAKISTNPFGPSPLEEALMVPMVSEPENTVPEGSPVMTQSSAREDHVPKGCNTVEVPKRISSKPRMIGSNRSSLSYGGDLTLDMKSSDDLGKNLSAAWKPYLPKTSQRRSSC